MEELRKKHNKAKDQLIKEWVKPHSFVLDCGCGRGGDFWKWKAVNACLVAIDPDKHSMEEAKRRTLSMNFKVHFLDTGDVRDAVRIGPFDVICYNFSIQYIVGPHFADTIKAIKKGIKPYGYLLGITPDENLVRTSKSPDALGNMYEIQGNEMLVKLSDGPFYADGPKLEPLMNRTILEQALAPEFTCVVWKPMMSSKTNLVSDIYSQFVFRKNID